MASLLGLPAWLVVLAVTGALLGLVYFLSLAVRQDHRTGEYHFTWGVGVVALFLMGFAPGLVGLGLYLTVERGWPLFWLAALLLGALVVVAAAGAGVEVTATGGEASLLASV